jgi:WD40 repeat protein
MLMSERSPPPPIEIVAFTPDGKSLLASNYSSMAEWSLTLEAQKPRLLGAESPALFAASADGRLGAASNFIGGEHIFLIDLPSGKVRRQLRGSTNGVFAFSADSRWLASAGADDRILVWNLR